MVEITQQLVPSHLASKVTSKGTNKQQWVTVHQTANPSKGAGAKAHANLQSRGNTRKASWHFQVDEHGAIQSFPLTAICWAAGDGGVGNTDSIHVELCVNSDGDYLKTLKNGAELVKYLIGVLNLPLNRVVQHNKWSGKNCPSHLRASHNGHSWGDFKNMVQGSYVGNSNPKPSVSKPSVSKPSVPKPSPKPTQSGGSVVDYMNSKGMNSSFNSRKQLATKYGIAGYIGSASQNIQLLNKLKAQSSVSAIVSKGANLAVDGYFGPLTIKALQRYFGTPVDGILSRPSLVIKKLQALVGARVDGYMGKETITKMQRYFGTPVDGVLSKPSVVIKALQRGLNKGKL